MHAQQPGAMFDVAQQDDVLSGGGQANDRYLDTPSEQLACLGGVHGGDAKPLQLLGDRAKHTRHPLREIGGSLEPFDAVNQQSLRPGPR